MMGKRGRALREAVAKGERLTVRQEKRELMLECMRLAAPRLFFSQDWDNMKVAQSSDAVTQLLIDVLPQALANTGRRYFTAEELSRDDDWLTMRARVVQGVATRNKRIQKHDRNGQLWRLRKGKGGRKPTGRWVLCAGCGVPRWVTPSRPVKRCRACYLAKRGA